MVAKRNKIKAVPPKLPAISERVTDEINILIDDEQWENLTVILDTPPRKILALRKLLTRPSVFDSAKSIAGNDAQN